jgi:hypothetical protein
MKKFKECLKWLASISVVGAGFGFIVSAIFFPKVAIVCAIIIMSIVLFMATAAIKFSIFKE